MLVFRNQVTEPIEYPIEQINQKDKVLYFDIETTGFSRSHCFIYLIGCMYYVGDTLMYTQWLAENKNDEANVLMAFHQFMQPFQTIIHFNGIGFDIPFVKERGEKINLHFDFNSKKQVDLYQCVSKIAPLLSLENKKQKTLEKFLKISRIDPFNGGELIELYQAYITSKDEKLLLPLLMHNKEDVWNMGKLTSLLSYMDFFLGKFQVSNFRNIRLSDDAVTKLSIELALENTVPQPIQFQRDGITLLLQENTATLMVSEICDTLKYYFDNYKDYYYLPLEDRAIHKSLAQFVDSKYRKKATKGTCYEKFSGTFLPLYQPTDSFLRTYQKDIKEKIYYVQTTDITEATIRSYVDNILSEICQIEPK